MEIWIRFTSVSRVASRGLRRVGLVLPTRTMRPEVATPPVFTAASFKWRSHCYYAWANGVSLSRSSSSTISTSAATSAASKFSMVPSSSASTYLNSAVLPAGVVLHRGGLSPFLAGGDTTTLPGTGTAAISVKSAMTSSRPAHYQSGSASDSVMA